MKPREGKIGAVMREFAAGRLRSSAGRQVTNKEQALAIGHSERRAVSRRLRKRK